MNRSDYTGTQAEQTGRYVGSCERSSPKFADREPEAERAFINSKLEMIRTDPTLSEDEKAAAMAEVGEKPSGPSHPPDPR